MEFRYATEKDTPQIRRLWEYSFEDQKTYLDWYFSEIYRPDFTLCCVEHKDIIASLQFAPYMINLRNSILKTNFIVAVNTLPGSRGQGYGKALIADAINKMAQMHVPISHLTPLSPSFYRACGYEFTYNELKWTYPLDSLTKLAAHKGKWREVNLNSDLELMNQIYQEMMHGQNAFTMRSPDNWRYILNTVSKEGGTAWLLMSEGKPSAYVIYYQDLAKRVFAVREIGYVSLEAQKSVFGFIAGHRNQLDTLEWNSMSSDIAYLEMAPEAAPVLAPSVMARIVSLAETLAAISYPLEQTSIIMKITDQVAPWNDNRWKLAIEDGRGKFSPAKDEEEAEVTMDISTLTCIVFGYLNPWMLAKNGQIQGSPWAISRLAKMFPPCYNYMGQYI